MASPQGEKRYRPSPSLYRFTYAELVRRDGELCGICGSPPPLDIDHRDGKKDTWVLASLRLLCRACNVTLQNSSIPTVKGGEREKEEWPETYEVRRHIQLEEDFDKALSKLLGEGPLTVKDAENRIAKVTGSTQVVVRRWIDRENTPEGTIFLSERQVGDGRKTKTEQFINRKPSRGS
jgi:hypothetical protein